MRGLYYTIGGLAMLGLLWVSVFGSTGHLVDPNAARGTLLVVFLAMHYQRRRFRSLRTIHVVWSSLAGGMVGACLGRSFWHFPLADWPEELAEAALASVFCAALMIVSFHFLTLRRGHMP